MAQVRINSQARGQKPRKVFSMVTQKSYIENQTSDGIVKVAVKLDKFGLLAYITLSVGRDAKKVHIAGKYLNEVIDMLVDIYEDCKSL